MDKSFYITKDRKGNELYSVKWLTLYIYNQILDNPKVSPVETVYKLITELELDDEIEKLFRDKKTLKRGEWSVYGEVCESVEVGLYYEPLEYHEDYRKGDYTLQVFWNDEVIGCFDYA